MNAVISQKAYKGIGMEGFIAKWYASLTQKSLDEFKALARRVARDLARKSRVLEVAPGPGYFAIELAKLGSYHVSGLDISHSFVEIASRNATQARVSINFQQGDAAAMPFADQSFDFLLCRAAFKNFSRPVGALQEMQRVLKPGGHALIIDLRRDASREELSTAVDGMHLGSFDAFLTKLTFRFMLLKRAYTREDFERFLAETSFEQIEIEQSPIGLELSLQRAAYSH